MPDRDRWCVLKYGPDRTAPLTYLGCAEPPATTKSSSTPAIDHRSHLFSEPPAGGVRQDGPTALNEVLFWQRPAENCTGVVFKVPLCRCLSPVTPCKFFVKQI